jgi:hypothetical protein
MEAVIEETKTRKRGTAPQMPHDEGQLPPRSERKYCWVLFAKGGEAQDKTVVVWLNGARFEFPRGVRCLVPQALIDGPLKDAIRINVEESAKGRVLTEEQTYPFQVQGEATAAEVEAHFSNTKQ